MPPTGMATAGFLRHQHDLTCISTYTVVLSPDVIVRAHIWSAVTKVSSQQTVVYVRRFKTRVSANENLPNVDVSIGTVRRELATRLRDAMFACVEWMYCTVLYNTLSASIFLGNSTDLPCISL